ncbi:MULTISPECIES: hypothetical protein [unclassified Streptomyces]|uniref:hypothetical protein n=1 Tax=unclassified Streptomyces TaxID=2593676 RepID=UPI0037FE7F93
MHRTGPGPGFRTAALITAVIMATATVIVPVLSGRHGNAAESPPAPAVSETISFTSRARPPADSPSPTPSPPDAPDIGALGVTPSGAARGGADHPGRPPARSAAAELSLAIGATAAATAGTILVVRRFQRRAADSTPHRWH